MPVKEYFDLHFHPLFKQYLSRYEEGSSDRTAAELEREIFLTNDLIRFLDRDFLHILGSQTSPEQMRKGGLLLGIANFVALEYGIASCSGLLGDMLRSDMTRPLDKKYFRKVRKGETSYYRLFLQELALYRKLSQPSGENAPSLSILSRVSTTEDQLKQPGIRLALALEGGHNLCRDLIGKPGKPDSAGIRAFGLPALENDFNGSRPDNPEGLGPAAQSLRRLMRALWEDGLDLLYLTLTHLTHIPQQLLATHAYGMKLLRHVSFYPQGTGLTPAGREVIKTAYSLKRGDRHMPVLIDVKHMSLQSRIEFYAYRQELDVKPPVPILATHMGVTGYSISGWRQAKTNAASMLINEDEGVVSVVQLTTARKVAGYWGSAINNEFTFNPWSVNLMDEDIEAILSSKGMIGVSLDVRILGFQAKIGLAAQVQPEYLSQPEYKTLFGAGAIKGSPVADVPADEAESWLVPTKLERQPIAFCFNVVHILTVAEERGIKNAWKYVCIGSDFDGLIDPVVTSPSAAELRELELAVRRWLPVAAAAYADENATPNVLGSTPASVTDIVRDILYQNGKDFLSRWLNSEPPGVQAAPDQSVPGS